MKLHEDNAAKGDLFTTGGEEFEQVSEQEVNPNGKVIDLVLPVAVLIVSAIGAMVYTGFLGGADNVISAFAGIFFRNNKRGNTPGFFIHHIVQELVIHVSLSQAFPDNLGPGTMKNFLEKIIYITKYEINDIPIFIKDQLLTNINRRHIVNQLSILRK